MTTLNVLEIEDILNFIISLRDGAMDSPYTEYPDLKEIQPGDQLLGYITDDIKRLIMMRRSVGDEQQLREDEWDKASGENIFSLPEQCKQSMDREDEITSDIKELIHDMIGIMMKIKFDISVGDIIRIRKGGAVVLTTRRIPRHPVKPLH